jgi:hypothetical protein
MAATGNWQLARQLCISNHSRAPDPLGRFRRQNSTRHNRGKMVREMGSTPNFCNRQKQNGCLAMATLAWHGFQDRSVAWPRPGLRFNAESAVAGEGGLPACGS